MSRDLLSDVQSRQRQLANRIGAVTRGRMTLPPEDASAIKALCMLCSSLLLVGLAIYIQFVIPDRTTVTEEQPASEQTVAALVASEQERFEATAGANAASPLDGSEMVFHESLMDRHPLFLVNTPAGGFHERSLAQDACELMDGELATVQQINQFNTTREGELQFFDFAWVKRHSTTTGKTVDVARPYSNDRRVQFLLKDETQLPMGELEARKLSENPRVQAAKANNKDKYPALCSKPSVIDQLRSA